MRNVFKITMISLGSLIGAGFASGQEIITFFVRNGAFSQIGMVIAVIILSLAIFFTLERNRKREKIRGRIYSVFTLFYLICGYIAMVAGTGALLNEFYKLSFSLGVIIFSILCYIVLASGSKGVVLLNSFLTPVIILGMFFCCVDVLFNSPQSIEIPYKNDWFFPSLLYASYNSLAIIPIISGLSELSCSRKTNAISAIVSGVILIILLFLIWNVLVRNISDAEIPIIISMEKFAAFYVPIMLISMFTTAISSGFGIISTKHTFKVGYVCTIGLLVSFFGFSNIVSVGYSFCGYLGFIVLYKLLRKK